MKFRSLISAITSIVILASCSSTQEAYIKNVNIYLDVKDGIQLSDEQIADSKADLIYMISGDKPQVTMALAFIENGDYKWVSRDNVVFIMQKGRLKRTSGLDRDLLYVGNLKDDPIKKGFDLKSGAIWARYLDSENESFGVKLTSQFEVNSNTNVSIQNKVFETVQITELVTFESSAHGVEQWTNTFWYHKESGELLKSIQKYSSDANIYNITYISRAIRLATQ